MSQDQIQTPANHNPAQPVAGSPQQSSQTEAPKAGAKFNDGKFGLKAIAEKRAAAIAALRGERGVAEPTPEAKSAPEAAPEAPKPSAEQLADPRVAEILAGYDMKIKAAQEAEAAMAARKTELAEQEVRAAEKLAKMQASIENPLDFLAEVGLTDDEWQNFLAGGGKLSPEQKKMKEMEKTIAAQKAEMAKFMESLQQEKIQASRQVQLATAKTLLEQNPLAKRMGNPEQVLQRQAQLSQAAGREVSVQEAVESLVNNYKKGMQDLLNDDGIRDMLELSVSKPPSGSAANSPTTLNGKLASSTTPGSGKPKPNDWAAKKALFLQQLAQQNNKR